MPFPCCSTGAARGGGSSAGKAALGAGLDDAHLGVSGRRLGSTGGELRLGLTYAGGKIGVVNLNQQVSPFDPLVIFY